MDEFDTERQEDLQEQFDIEVMGLMSEYEREGLYLPLIGRVLIVNAVSRLICGAKTELGAISTVQEFVQDGINHYVRTHENGHDHE